MKGKDLKLGVKDPRLRSRLSLYGPGNRLRKVVDTRWVPAGSGLMKLRTDSYKMSATISKREQRAFESRRRLKKGSRPYSHKISGIGKFGPIKGVETAHGIETRRRGGKKLKG